MLKFITGNKGKFREVSLNLQPLKIKRLNVDLDEIQDLDPYKIIRHKLNEAFKHQSKNFIIEDTSFYYEALKNKLPGPFMKYFLEALRPVGVYRLAKKLGETTTEMRTIIAYAESRNKVYFFEGKIMGKMVSPRSIGKYGFGVDSIFMPKGSNKTLSQLKGPEGSELSARSVAARKLKTFLLKNDPKGTTAS